MKRSRPEDKPDVVQQVEAVRLISTFSTPNLDPKCTPSFRTLNLGSGPQESKALREGDWRYSVMPGAVPRDKMVQFATDFFKTTELLSKVC